jgi:hypothetical protein
VSILLDHFEDEYPNFWKQMQQVPIPAELDSTKGIAKAKGKGKAKAKATSSSAAA